MGRAIYIYLVDSLLDQKAHFQIRYMHSAQLPRPALCRLRRLSRRWSRRISYLRHQARWQRNASRTRATEPAAVKAYHATGGNCADHCAQVRTPASTTARHCWPKHFRVAHLQQAESAHAHASASRSAAPRSWSGRLNPVRARWSGRSRDGRADRPDAALQLRGRPGPARLRANSLGQTLAAGRSATRT